MKTNKNALSVLFALLVAASLLLSSCGPQPTPVPTSIPTRVPSVTPPPTATPVPLPAISLQAGDFYFSVNGQLGFIFSRNIAGYQQVHYDTFLDWTREGGGSFARIQLDSLGMGYTSTGAVDESWAAQWERVFDKAEADGIYILPVFSGWFDWNAGDGYSTWTSNPLNVANGGPVQSPAELFQNGSATQSMWMQWMQTLVKRWQGRKNILGWEVFSEVNLATGVTELSGIDFVNSAVTIIRAADPNNRPVTASQADVGNWPNFYRDTAIDFINIHPYSAQLDRNIVSGVRYYLTTYNRPVLIGESGLSADTPDSTKGAVTIAENAPLGARHAIWAAIVSGAMNGRSLYWEDSFGIYFSNLGVPWMEKYKTEELPAVKFVSGIDFSGFQPLASISSPDVWGAAVGNEKMVLGWFRDAASEPPDWNMQTVISGETVTITILGTAENWQVDFYDTRTGTTIVSSASVTRQGGTISVPLPDFQDDIAFKMTAQAGTAAFTVAAPGKTDTPATPGNTDAIAGKWDGNIKNQAGTFSTPVELSIQPGCKPGQVCGTFAAPQLPCSGDLYLKDISTEIFVFIEQNATGAVSCISGGYETLQLLADGTLSYKYSYTQVSTATSNGILHRP